MSSKVPDEVEKKVKVLVYNAADEFNYLASSRIENGKFLDSLVARDDVGGQLSSFMKKAEVRTYIKDAILNRYSKDQTQQAKPKDITKIIKKNFGFEVGLVEEDKRSNVALYKSVSSERPNCYVVVSEGTYIKWETALRKALLFLPGKPFAENGQNTIHIMLNVFAQHRKITPADKKCLLSALGRFGVTVYIYGQS